MAVRTELEFPYKPHDMSEAKTVFALRYGELTIDGGKATYVLASPADPVPEALLAFTTVGARIAIV